MSRLAYSRYMNRKMLTGEEQQHKEELITVIEEVLQAKNIACDERIGKMSDPELLEILGASQNIKTGLEEKEGGTGTG